MQLHPFLLEMTFIQVTLKDRFGRGSPEKEKHDQTNQLIFESSIMQHNSEGKINDSKGSGDCGENQGFLEKHYAFKGWEKEWISDSSLKYYWSYSNES